MNRQQAAAFVAEHSDDDDDLDLEDVASTASDVDSLPSEGSSHHSSGSEDSAEGVTPKNHISKN